jgi:pimeloyl-ACP methyl ester carboxylesterase
MTGSTPSTFVLVHGSAHGGWCWRKVAQGLRAAGHDVFAPTLTGLGERRHLLTQSIGLNTHCQDIISVIECEELQDVILVGHSYAGIVISMVADRRPQGLKRLVYLDAQVPSDGESWADRQPELAPERITSAIRYSSEHNLPTVVMQFTPPMDTARFLGVSDAADIAWVNRRVSDHPLATYIEPARLTHPIGNGVAKTYIACTGKTLPVFDKSKAKAQSEAGWDYVTLDGGHDCMVSEPDAVTNALLKCT